MIENPFFRWTATLKDSFRLTRLRRLRLAAMTLLLAGTVAALPLLMDSLLSRLFVLQFTLAGICLLGAAALGIRAPLPAPADPPGRDWRQRPEILACPLIIGLLIATGILIERGITAQADARIRILVADFTGPSPEHYPVAATLVQHLCRETLGQDRVQIIPLPRSISEDLEGSTPKALLRRYHADLAIWGWYGPGSEGVMVGMHVRMNGQERRMAGPRVALYPRLRPLSCPLPTRFTLQTRWNRNGLDLALFVAGLSHYLQHRPRRAVAEWTTALEHSPLSRNGLPELFRGSAWLELGHPRAAAADAAAAIGRSPHLAEAWNLSGVAQAVAGTGKAAPAALERAAELAPDWPVPLCNQGIVMARLGDPAGARTAFASALHRLPGDADSMFNLAGMAVEGKDWPEAEPLLSRLIRRQPYAADARYYRAICRYHGGDMDGALDDLTWAVRLRPTWSRALHDLGVVHARRGNLFMAIRAFTRALARHPRRLETRRLRAAAFYMEKDYAHAAAECSRILKLATNDRQALTDRGRALFRLGDLPGAARDFTRLVTLWPREPRFLSLRGKVALEADDPQAAEADFSRALALDLDTPSAWTGRALARLMQDRLSESLADLKHALIRRPDNPHLCLLAGMIHRQMGQYTESAACILRAGELAPKDPAPPFQLGLTRVLEQDPPGAEAAFTRAIRLKPDHHEALNFRGVLRLAAGNIAGALADLEMAATLVPEEPAYRLSRGNAYLVAGRTEQAIRDYRAAATLVPDDPIPEFFTGQALEEEGKYAAALSVYRDALGRAQQAALPLFQALKRRIAELERDALWLGYRDPDSGKDGKP